MEQNHVLGLSEKNITGEKETKLRNNLCKYIYNFLYIFKFNSTELKADWYDIVQIFWSKIKNLI